MSFPKKVKGGYLTVAVEDPDNAGQFLTLCGLTSRTHNEQFNTSDSFDADCADPESVPERNVDVTGHQHSISGEGRYNRAQAALLRTIKGKSLTYRFNYSENPADPVDAGYYEGPAVLTSWSRTGADGSYATASISIESDGEWEWHDAP